MSWQEGLPAELVAAPFFRSAETMEQAIADMTHAAETASNSLRVPGPDADDTARQEFYARVAEKAPGLMPKPDLDDATAMAALIGLANEHPRSKGTGAQVTLVAGAGFGQDPTMLKLRKAV